MANLDYVNRDIQFDQQSAEIAGLRAAVELAIDWINPESDPKPFTHRDMVAKLRRALER